MFGGRVTDDPGCVSKVLIAHQRRRLPAAAGCRPEFTTALLTDRRAGLRPVDARVVGVADGEVYRLLTAAFLHGSILHLALNMYALFLFGPPLEAALGRAALHRPVPHRGARAAAPLSYAFSAPGQASLGASGAVFGLLGAFLVVNRRLGRDTSRVLVLLGHQPRRSGSSCRASTGGPTSAGWSPALLCAAALAYAPRESQRTLVQVAGRWRRCWPLVVIVGLDLRTQFGSDRGRREP